jgi:hypothetical protein
MALTQRKKRPIVRSVEILRDTRLLIIATEGRITEKQRSCVTPFKIRF